ncbi:MAG: DUF503 domain-containing protein [Candidatus Marinimicrobia bacterium]|jgi:hypothetical protein|nr:DUF503 domain-containing protein [Candidatus Neomarinimicrobiota bacterium]MBT3631971.1 DUF503 domain-containing protein [Candidatus Neomarinimicrobiota bacterium]MBT3824557.1 DUF503 domain-containing protein [Candidatus Neomarinimicrobiota bacterium]MBT4130268.1 DUF503 domain-containing protein [Candidatus Neomarinimicrobiota bacterium]MBT4297019.1 DUF503 domain-containing protein [Candidatus Neomarinimicrobiota bacterium]
MLLTGILQIELHLPAAQSLKQKRSVVKSLKDRLRSRYNVSVSEFDYLDKWQHAAIAVAMVSTDKAYLDSRFQSISHFIDDEIIGHAYILKSELTIL